MPCDQQQIDTSQHDLITELKDAFKTAAPQECEVDCIIIYYALN